MREDETASPVADEASFDNIAGNTADGTPQELPEGIIRVGEKALASERLLSPEMLAACSSFGTGEQHSFYADKPVQIAVFDFDATCIDANSPVVLVRYLSRYNMLKRSVVARILAWAVAYKLHLPQNESWVRGLVFSAFCGQSVAKVNTFLRTFYDEHIACHFRQPIAEIITKHAQAGHVVMCVSATFEPIIAQVMCEHPIHFGIATRMKIDASGRYTAQVDGKPIEGAEKIAVLKAFADEFFGVDGWELGWAYGDHYSDQLLLSSARNGCAVEPDHALTRIANKEGFEILRFDDVSQVDSATKVSQKT